MSAADYAAIENRLRRMADRQSLQLVRSRRHARGTEPCKYMLIDPFTSAVTTGGDWSLDLADVEHILLTVGPAARHANARDCPTCSTPTYTLSGLVKGARVDEPRMSDMRLHICRPAEPTATRRPVDRRGVPTAICERSRRGRERFRPPGPGAAMKACPHPGHSPASQRSR